MDGYCIIVKGKQIEAVLPQSQIGRLPGYRVIDADGAYVSAGFIELHTHGIEGYDFMDNQADGLKKALRAYAKYGVTSVYPTTMSAPVSELEAVLDGFSALYGFEYDGAEFMGVHLEGPYFNPKQCGAQSADYLKSPDFQEYQYFVKKYPFIKRWDIAPELDGANEMAQYLTKRGIKAGIAHTNATATQILNAEKHGFTIATHLYSGMSGVTRINGYRHGGAVEGCLIADSITVELIGDGIHLPAELVHLAYRGKGPEKIALVTDSMRGAGMPENSECVLGNRHTGIKTVIQDGVAWLTDKSAFAGSIATYNQLIRNFVKLFKIPLPHVISMATTTPAKAMSLKNKGDLKKGFDADIVIFDDDIRIHKTIVKGKTVYTS